MHTGKKNWYIHKYKTEDYAMNMLHCYINSIDANFESKPFDDKLVMIRNV